MLPFELINSISVIVINVTRNILDCDQSN